MTTLAEHMIVAGAENRPPMLDKTMYNSWQSRMFLYIKEKKNGRMMLESIENGPLVYPTIEENGAIRPKKYAELTEQEMLQDDCDAAKDIWDTVNLLMKGTELSYQERKQVPVNTKFMNALQPEWSKFVTDVKLAKNLYTTNNDQLYAYLSQLEGHANEARMLRERYPDPLALGETMQLVKQGLLSVITVRVKGIWQGSALNQKGQGILHDPGIPDGQAIQKTIQQNAAFQTDDLDDYDSDYDDISSAKAVLMAYLSSYDSDVLSKHTKLVFKEEVIPFINYLRLSFKDFENGLHNELNVGKMVFNQMEAAVDQCSVDKKYFDIQKKELSLDNDRLLDHIICQDVMNIVMHADSVPVNVLPADNKCLVNDNLEIERLEQ
ncbi:hypothetical protein Tco_0474804 [Tanacetum coccineum]